MSRLYVPFGRELLECDHDRGARDAEFGRETAGRRQPGASAEASGTQQGLGLAARILVDPGDPVCVEDRCYRVAAEILRAAESRIVPVAVDAGGVDIAGG